MRLTRTTNPPQGSTRGGSGAHLTAPGLTGGSLVAIVTPFRAGRLDTATLAALVERQVAGGTAGIVVCGSTGEAAALSAAEQLRAIAATREAVAGRVPVIAGCSAPATAAAARLAVAAAQSGADALLCAPPPYSKPTQQGIAAHVRAVADSARLPVILYDVPGRTGVAIADLTIADLFRSGAIVALKDATADLARPARLRALAEGLVQLTGDDATAAAYRAMGGHGCISVTANVVPALCARLHRAWDRADLAELARLRDLLAPLHDALFAETNPIPVKAALHAAGLCEAELRLPLTRATEATVRHLEAILPAILAAEALAAGRPNATHSGVARLTLVS